MTAERDVAVNSDEADMVLVTGRRGPLSRGIGLEATGNASLSRHGFGVANHSSTSNPCPCDFDAHKASFGVIVRAVKAIIR